MDHPLILLVEDNATIRDAFSILLSDSGYRVLQADSGERALAVSEEQLPDLILLDLGLPDVPGIQLAKTLKSRPSTREVPIVALTGHALDANRDACIAAGCAGYLTKPIDADQLLRRLPEFLEPASAN